MGTLDWQLREPEGAARSGGAALPWGELVASSEGDGPAKPWRVSVRDLARNVSKVLALVHNEACPSVVTYRGTPTWVILPLDQRKLASFLLGNVEKLTEDIIRSGGDADDEDVQKLLEKGDLPRLSDLMGDPG